MKYFNKSNTMKANVLMSIGVAIVLSSGCYSNGNDPGVEFSANMYDSEAYEAYTQLEEMKYNPYGMTMRLPVNGTVAQGQMDYLGYPEGYEASSSWSNPLAATEANVAEGNRLYDINCQHCHGKTGKNDGGVIKSGQYPPPPWSSLSEQYIKDLPDGKIYHTITHGKNNMGSHAALLTPDQRWKVLMYVRKLSLGDAFVYSTASKTEKNTSSASVKPKWLTGFEFANISVVDYNMISGAMKNVQFDNIRFKKMRDESKPFLDQVAKYMNEHPDLKAVVVGHLSSDAEMDKIQEGLSDIRAQAVIDYLVEKGVNISRLTGKGMGSKEPIASNDTKEGREMNRRVELYFIK